MTGLSKGKEYASPRAGCKANADGSSPISRWLHQREHALAEGHGYFDLGDFEISPDNNLCAYSVDTVSRRQYVLRFRDLRTGAELPDVIAQYKVVAVHGRTTSCHCGPQEQDAP
ncbi:MAG: hypothetical protein IPP33_09710 [Flavobacteriales bacterium]|nr:hypothetical protein [Flavobacteriales bacterium]